MAAIATAKPKYLVKEGRLEKRVERGLKGFIFGKI